jgi:thiamine pyrophosphate-dependent acetolactate synthase large subunit-like protein
VNRLECIDAFARLRADAIVVVGPGFAGHELASARHHDLTLYNMDMGYAAPLCLGLALARPEQRVVALEGDGSLLMSLPTLTTIARYPAANLTVIVFDNGYYLTTGSGRVASATHRVADLVALGRAAGLPRVDAPRELAAFEAVAARALSEPGPWFIVAAVDTSDRAERRARGGFPHDLVEQSVLFQVALRSRMT